MSSKQTFFYAVTKEVDFFYFFTDFSNLVNAYTRSLLCQILIFLKCSDQNITFAFYLNIPIRYKYKFQYFIK